MVRRICRYMLLVVLWAMVAVPPIYAQQDRQKNQPKVGVSLSGGGALGYAHLGFLQAMDEAGLKPDCLAGTSMGAIMGVLYAAGYSPRDIMQIVHREHMDGIFRFFRLNFRFNGGLMDTRRIQRILLDYIPHNSFDSLSTRFYCCTSDMNNLQPDYIGHGDQLAQFVMASAALPGILAPVEINNIFYVDGGIHDNLPVVPLIGEGCDIRIGVAIRIEQPHNIKNGRGIWKHAYSYATYANTLANLGKFDDVVIIDPVGYWLTDFDDADELFEIGYRAGREYFKDFDLSNFTR